MKGYHCVGALLAATFLAATAWHQGAVVVSVTEHGARGDGKTLDRAALNRAVEACAEAGGGQVRVPPGRYLTGTVRLRSGITLVLDAGAVLVGRRTLTSTRATRLRRAGRGIATTGIGPWSWAWASKT
jgi:Pectate lyase superfamily protein